VPKIFKSLSASLSHYSSFFLLLLVACTSTPTLEDFKIYENFISIVSDLQRHLEDDVYRFPLAKDASGQNVFKATLVRLENYQKLYPERFKELVAYSKAKSHQKLGNFEEALFFFKETQDYRGKLLSLAQNDIAFTENLIHIFNSPVRDRTLEGIFEQFDRRETLFRQLLLNSALSPSEKSLILREIERNLVAKADFSFKNRFKIGEGSQALTLLALQLYQRLLQEHPESKQIYRHYLQLADSYVTLAKEYIQYHPPDTFGFKKEDFYKLTQPALDIYRLLSQVDGRLEKVEAQGNLIAFMAFIQHFEEDSR
jgi:hypothetical protein